MTYSDFSPKKQDHELEQTPQQPSGFRFKNIFKKRLQKL